MDDFPRPMDDADFPLVECIRPDQGAFCIRRWPPNFSLMIDNLTQTGDDFTYTSHNVAGVPHYGMLISSSPVRYQLQVKLDGAPDPVRCVFCGEVGGFFCFPLTPAAPATVLQMELFKP